MSKVLVSEANLSAIASAIRAKNGEETTYKPGDMATAIRAIDSGYPEPTGTITISQNGTANVKDYAEATVNVQPVLQQKTATQNGTVTPDTGYDGLSSVVVDVQGGGSAVIQSLSVTHNGTFTPPSGVDGYAPVTVNVSGGSVPELPSAYQKVEYIRTTGTQYAEIPFQVLAKDIVKCGLALSSSAETSESGAIGAYRGDYGSVGDTWEFYFRSDKLSVYTGAGSTFYFEGSDSTPIVRDTATYFAVAFSTDRPSRFKVGQYRASAYKFNGMIYDLSIYRWQNYNNMFYLALALVPCYRKSDNEPGFYDVVNNVFYTNVGSDTFGVGPDLN